MLILSAVLLSFLAAVFCVFKKLRPPIVRHSIVTGLLVVVWLLLSAGDNGEIAILLWLGIVPLSFLLTIITAALLHADGTRFEGDGTHLR